MSHANAALTPRARLRLARLIAEDGWLVALAARRYDVAWPTAKRWADRYRALGESGMADRSSRPHRVANQTSPYRVRKIAHLRRKKRLSPIAISARVRIPASTVRAVLVRCRLNRLSHVAVRTCSPGSARNSECSTCLRLQLRVPHRRAAGCTGMWTNTNLRAWWGWIEATRRAGVEGTTIHDLRHTAASVLIAAGADVKPIQVILEHSTATMTMTMTMDLYGHLFSEATWQAM